jgi:hypothetical protein
MRKLHDVRWLLERLPRGFLADGRPLGLGLASALQAQRARRELTPTVLHEQIDDRFTGSVR